MKNNLKAACGLGTVLPMLAIMILFSSTILEGKPFRAGVSKVNITRDNPTARVNDPLFSKALVLDDGKTRVVIITIDIIEISFAEVDKLKTLIEKELKIDRNNIIINVSHNHWVNDQLAGDYLYKTFATVKEANQKMVSVNVGSGAGIEKRISMNRRLVLKDGKEWTIRRATPEPEDDLVEDIAEPFDPEIGILRIDKTDGKPFAVLYTFVSGYTNGLVGYAPTADAYNGDAYEVSWSDLAPEWQKIYEEKVLEIINKLKK